MARIFLTALDLQANELQNAVVQNLATAPSTPTAGRIYYDTVANALYYYNGTSWQQLATGATLSYGTVTAQTSYGLSSDNGSASSVSRSDHTHGTPSLTSNLPSTQAVGDSAAVGTGTAPARDDHKHAMPGFGSVTAQTSFAASSGNGSASSIARSDHTHGTPTHDGAAHSSISLSSLAAPTGTLSMGSQIVSNVATPVASTDAANKGYVDGIAQGLDVKGSVRAATTTAGTLATSFANGQTIDGVTLATGNRILVKNQATASENGIYVVAASGAPTRATDMDAAGEFSGGFTFVEEGTTNADTGWVCTTNEPVTVGSTSITFAQFSGAGTYAAGNGITLSGTTFSFNPTSTGGLQAAAGGASILKPTNSGLVTDATGLYVGAGTGITVSGTNVSLTNTSVTVNGTAISLGSSGTITANTTNALTLGTGLTGTSFNGSSAVTAAIDTSVVVRKYAVTLSTSATSYTVNHALNTRDVTVTVYDTSGAPYAEVVVDVEHTDANNVTVRFSTAPSANKYRVVVQG